MVFYFFSRHFCSYTRLINILTDKYSNLLYLFTKLIYFTTNGTTTPAEDKYRPLIYIMFIVYISMIHTHYIDILIFNIPAYNT